MARKALPNQYEKTDYGYLIEIDSPKYGLKYVKISDCDYERAIKHKRSVSREGNKKTNKGGFKMYANARIGLMHRYLTSAPKGMVVDHINGDSLDNRQDNLRVCTQSQNRMNATKIPYHNATGVIGVCWNNATQKWLAYIYKNYKRIYLGDHANFEDAVDARKQAEKELFAEYKNVQDVS